MDPNTTHGNQTMQKPRPHWTTDLILVQKPNDAFPYSIFSHLGVWLRVSHISLTWVGVSHIPWTYDSHGLTVKRRRHCAIQLTYDRDCTYTWTVLLPYTVVRTVDVSCNSVNSHSFVTTTLLAACLVQATLCGLIQIYSTWGCITDNMAIFIISYSPWLLFIDISSIVLDFSSPSPHVTDHIP